MKKIELDSRNSLKIDNDLYYYNFSNLGNSKALVYYETEIRFIQFHFCLSGNLSFEYNNGAYSFPLQKDNSILLFNPSTNLPINVIMGSETKLISILISIKKFHSLFSETSDLIPFLSDENIDKKYYKDHVFTPSMAVVLSQILQHQPNTLMSRLYLKGKVYELLSLYFNPSEATDIAECPFLVDEENVRKIRNAKKIMLARMTAPPSLTELADEIGLSLKKLKEGFKQLYGSTVYQFVLDHKMNHARQLLGTGSHNVNEVAIQLGYSNSSHFIEAFKKKFGTTPKKYLLSVS